MAPSISRKSGTLESWHASRHGGWGIVITSSGEKYFLHRQFIKSGQPLPGSSVIFTPQPPANDSRKYPQACGVIINSYSTAAKTSTFDFSKIINKDVINGGAS